MNRQRLTAPKSPHSASRPSENYRIRRVLSCPKNLFIRRLRPIAYSYADCCHVKNQRTPSGALYSCITRRFLCISQRRRSRFMSFAVELFVSARKSRRTDSAIHSKPSLSDMKNSLSENPLGSHFSPDFAECGFCLDGRQHSSA